MEEEEEQKILIFVQFGYSKSLKEGQKLTVCHNDMPVNIDDTVRYLTPVSSRKTKLFCIKPLECQEGDIIKIESKVGLRLLGEDENRSFIGLYKVNKDKHIEYSFPGVGFGSGFPLLKGKVEVLSVLTSKERRLNGIRDMMEENDES